MTVTRRSFFAQTLSLSAALPLLHAPALKAQSAPAVHVKDPAKLVPLSAQIALDDLLTQAAHLQRGQKVLVVACLDGLHGGDNLVDAQTIEWLCNAIHDRGASSEVLWLNEISSFGQWKFSDELREAMGRCDLMINHSFDLTVEEVLDFRKYVESTPTLPMVRNFATTTALLNTAWARTPQELVNEIRFRAAEHITVGATWRITDPNGTHLEGIVAPARDPKAGYAVRREAGHYFPWPEWVCPPINLQHTNGTITNDRTLRWWSRDIGIPPYFEKPITIKIEDGRMVAIEGGSEAALLKKFLKMLHDKIGMGDDVYAFNTLHFGVHPQAHVVAHPCPSVLYRCMIGHSDARNLHVHIGSPKATPAFPYWPHITGDLRNCDFSIGDFQMHKNGRLTVLDDPAVKAVEARYPGRPGVEQEPCEG